MMVNSKTTEDMVEVGSSGPMVEYMMVAGKLVNNTAKAYSSLKTKQKNAVNGKMAKELNGYLNKPDVQTQQILNFQSDKIKSS